MTPLLVLTMVGCLFILIGLFMVYDMFPKREPESQPELTMSMDETSPNSEPIEDEDYRRISEGSVPVVAARPRYKGLMEDSDPHMAARH